MASADILSETILAEKHSNLFVSVTFSSGRVKILRENGISKLPPTHENSRGICAAYSSAGLRLPLY
jgi:hypothetical protein